MTLKQNIHQHYLQLANEKVNLLQQVLNELKESSSNETKSTAGDKHETALAMLQIEQEQKRNQLKEARLQQAEMEKINPSIIAECIVKGSLITTSKGCLFMSVALGKSVVDGIVVTALSPQSPLGRQLMGQKTGAIIVFNNNQYLIESIA
jgi:hypothetical protein